MNTVAYRVMNGLSALYGAGRRLVPEPLKTVDGMVNRVLSHTRRVMPYDDRTATFLGGELESLTALNYEKALRNLWKAGVVAPDLGIRDASPEDLEVASSVVMERVRSATFREKIEDTFSPEQRVALARLFSIVVHGEAYALFVAASLLPGVKGTGPKLGLSMQVLEEAKHFLVLREVVRQIDRVHEQTAAERILFERILAARPLDRLFGMNLIIETVALSFFSLFASAPGLDGVLPFFHLDESRHTAFPLSYTRVAPLSSWERYSPIAQTRRLLLVVPTLAVISQYEDDARILGFNIHEFGGKCLEKVFRLSERGGFSLLLTRKDAIRIYNLLYNSYYRISEGPTWTPMDFTSRRSFTESAELRAREDELFGTDDEAQGPLDLALEAPKRALFGALNGFLAASVAASSD